ncbi:MAG: glycosyltransferase family 9 protein [Verrucomicrobiota bacterium]
MKRIIFSRPDRVGDVIITSACAPLIKAIYPDVSLCLLSKPDMIPLFSGGCQFQEFISWTGEENPEFLKERMSDFRADAILHFHPHREVQQASMEAEIPRRYGFESPFARETLTHIIPYRKSEGKHHEAEYCRELLVSAFGENTPELMGYNISIDPQYRDSLRQKMPPNYSFKNCVVINPTTARLDLRWPAERFAKLAQSLVDLGKKIIVIGHPETDPALRLMRQRCLHLRDNFLDLGGKLNLAETAFLLQQSGLHISRDTGTSHLAAAVDCPQIVIMARLEGEFGPTRWAPLGKRGVVVATRAKKRWYETKRQFWRRSFRSIETKRVLEAARCELEKD